MSEFTKVELPSPDGAAEIKISEEFVSTDTLANEIIGYSKDVTHSHPHHPHPPHYHPPHPHALHRRHSHQELHFEGADILRDIVVGLSDGLTVPFALSAGLASLGNSRFVVLAGMAEIVAGAISMGLGGYLAGQSEIEHYNSEYAREEREVREVPHHEEAEIVELFEPYGMDRKSIEPLLSKLTANPKVWVEFMMKYELNLEKPDASRVWISALTIGGSYFMGGLVPLIPYMVVSNSTIAFYISIGVTLVVLFIFGFVKGRLLGVLSPIRSAFEMMLIGGLASSAAFGIAKAVPQP
ncbi:DUF125-domain-containing protein [Rhizoclosmatium globosum]|uniref:DUF125-domain-containing protein n=1 Tax=Rhizoclosmatium globosum TaxID=329046 RepID=A0A1Y2CYE9_9FUNG|nr:DUF125-domain-containing protein [Rhizoclosmatium globosum]|eukprot:ORY52072.1 DUF125-domain-containing protein [Rhizoclosmatium globosum]